MSSTTTIIPVENKEKQKPQIELKHSKVNDWLDSITEYLGAWSVVLGTVIRFILFVIVASLIVEQFGEDKEWLMVGIIALIFFADIGFSFSALLAAKFYNLGVRHYAILFFVISVIGLLFIAWKLNDFTNVLYPLLDDEDLVTEFAKNKNSENAHLNYSLKTIFFLSDFLAFIFTEGGAYMIFAFTSKEERNTETSEMRNSETAPKHTENDVSQDSEEEAQGESYEIPEGMKVSFAIPLPDTIKKIDENLYEVSSQKNSLGSYSTPKNLEGWRGNARTNSDQAKDAGDPTTQARKQAYANLYSYIVDTILRMEEEHPHSNWEVHPNSLNPYQNVKRDYEKNDFYSGSLNGHAK